MLANQRLIRQSWESDYRLSWLLHKSLSEWKPFCSMWVQFQFVKAVWACEKSLKLERNQQRSNRTRDLNATPSYIRWSFGIAREKATWAAVGPTTWNNSVQTAVPLPLLETVTSQKTVHKKSLEPWCSSLETQLMNCVWRSLTDRSVWNMESKVTWHISQSLTVVSILFNLNRWLVILSEYWITSCHSMSHCLIFFDDISSKTCWRFKKDWVAGPFELKRTCVGTSWWGWAQAQNRQLKVRTEQTFFN
jgi:hypothetical protein